MVAVAQLVGLIQPVRLVLEVLFVLQELHLQAIFLFLLKAQLYGGIAMGLVEDLQLMVVMLRIKLLLRSMLLAVPIIKPMFILLLLGHQLQIQLSVLKEHFLDQLPLFQLKVLLFLGHV